MTIHAQPKQRSAALQGALELARNDSSYDQPMHVVDMLIEERAGRLRDHPLLWQTVRRSLYPWLKYREAIELADQVMPLAGRTIFDHVSDKLDLRLSIEGLEHVPQKGFIFVAANHPTGIADGVAVYDALKSVRPDLCFMANRDAVRVAKGLSKMIIPVDWRKEYRTTTKTRETLNGLSKAAREQRTVVVFPSGRLAYRRWNGLHERPWLPTIVTLARKYKAPIVPLKIEARNSWLYYTLASLSNELRDITVFNEFLNKADGRFKMTFAPPFSTNDLPTDPERAIRALQDIVENRLGH